MTACTQILLNTINARLGNFAWKGGSHNSCKKFHFLQQILSRLLRWNYTYKKKKLLIYQNLLCQKLLQKNVSILNFMLNTNLKTTENKKVEVFVHFSTIMKSDSNASSVTAVPCSCWSSCEARWLQPSLREEKLDLPITTNNMFIIFSFFFLFFLFQFILSFLFLFLSAKSESKSFGSLDGSYGLCYPFAVWSEARAWGPAHTLKHSVPDVVFWDWLGVFT